MKMEQEIEVKKKPNKFLKFLINFVFILLLLVCIGVFVFKLVYVETAVLGASMYPTLNSTEYNDSVLINTKEKGTVGDIVVVDSLKADISVEHTYIIKRIIAKENERVDLRFDNDQMYIYIDGVKLEENYTTTPAYINRGSTPYIYNAFQNYLITNSENIDYNENGLLIPSGCVFVMGDNRQNSTDSASFGPVSVDSILGRVDVIIHHGESMLGNFFQYLFNRIFG